MEIKIEGSKKYKKIVEALLPSMIKQLNLENCKKALLIKVTKDIENNADGCSIDMAKMFDCYLVLVQPSRSVGHFGETLAHEMVHVKQMAKGQLKTKSPTNVSWCGKKYNPAKTAYLNQAWEVEAFSRQALIFRRAWESI